MKVYKLSTKLFILSGLICYIVLLCSAPLLHDHSCVEHEQKHEHEHEPKHCDHENENEEEQKSHTAESCAACAFINTQFTFAYQPHTISYQKPCTGKVIVIETCFVDLIPIRNLHSRAPPPISSS